MNRRELIAGAALAGFVAAIPTKAALPRQPDRREWDRAMRTHLAAVAASSAFTPEYDRIDAAHQEAVHAVPHTTIKNPWGGTLSTADRGDVASARNSQTNLRYLEDVGGNYAHARAQYELVKAADERDATIAEIDRRFDWDAVNERYDRLVDAVAETEMAVIALPAPDGEALMWKIERLYKPGDGMWSEGVEDQTHADLRRFLLSGRA